MHHRAHAVLAERKHADVLLAELSAKLCRRAKTRIDLEDDDVRLDLSRDKLQRIRLADGVGKDLSVGMIVGEPVDVMVEGVARRRGEQTSLPPAAAECFAQTTGLLDVVARADERRADRR